MVVVKCELRREEILVKKFIKATSAVKNNCRSGSTKKATQCVIVRGLRENNKETATILKNKGEQTSLSCEAVRLQGMEGANKKQRLPRSDAK